MYYLHPMNKTKQIIELLSTKYSFDRVDAEKYLQEQLNLRDNQSMFLVSENIKTGILFCRFVGLFIRKDVKTFENVMVCLINVKIKLPMVSSVKHVKIT